MVTSLVVGIIAVVCTALSFFGIPYVGFVGLVMGIVAWVMGSKATRFDAQDTKAKAGKILGIVVTILAIISLIVGIVVVGSVLGAAVLAEV